MVEGRGSRVEAELALTNFFDFLKRTFAGEHDEEQPSSRGKFHAGGAGDGHLGSKRGIGKGGECS